MYKKIKSKINERNSKSGAVTIEMIVILMIFMMMLGFFIDIFMIINKQYIATKQANIVTRQIALQGGLDISEPPEHERFGQRYETSAVILNETGKRLSGVGIDDFKIGIHLPDKHPEDKFQIIENKTVMPVSYGDRFDLRIDYDYEWFITSQFIPGIGGKNVRTIVRSGVSEYGQGD